jgi:hypothetical protein
MEISFCDFYDNASGNFSGSLPSGLAELVNINVNGDSCDIFNNIFMDPAFFATSGDSAFHLTEDSPCIDAGDPSSPMDPDNTIADIGAFYFHQSTAFPEILVSTESLIFNPTLVLSVDSLMLTIYNVGTADLIIDSLVCAEYPGVFTTNWNIEDTLIAPNDSLGLCIYFLPVDTLNYSDSLYVYSNDGLVGIYLEGEGLPEVGVDDQSAGFPYSFILHNPNPNPFNTITQIRFIIPYSTHVRLTIYDICGRKISTLINKQYSAGEHSVIFDASQLVSGMYLVRLNADNCQQTKKLLLIK